MVPHSYGTAVNCLRCDAFVEPPPRCSRPGLADWLLRDRVRNAGDYFGLPLAQLTDIACTLINNKLRSSSCCWSAFNADCKGTSKPDKWLTHELPGPAAHATSCFVLLIWRIPVRSAFFARRIALAVVLLKKMRLRVMDWAITLRL
jgi:hypothetical protein